MAASMLALLGACKPLERPESLYATRAEAAAAGAIERGWVPELVPESAREIREIHDLDTNEVCMRFELPVDERGDLVAPLHQLHHDEIEALPATCRLHPRWWFEGMIQQQPSNDSALYSYIYEVPVPAWPEGALMAVDRNSSSIYVWSR